MMSAGKGLTADQVIDTFGEVIACLSAFSAKVPATTTMTIPGGIRPTPEAVETYESIVYKFRNQSGMTYRALNIFFIDSLEAFEAGRVYDAVPPLLLAIEQLVELHKEEKVQYTSDQQAKIREYHRRLEKILPDKNKPEVDLPEPETY